ncbi:DnaJ family domain-containing protein [Nocardia sp. N13]|uniref:DnaJ family domain-containing protein n=1 Tax=Nocardioides sp. N13(2025) TaxID=3453405 RepID=UPI003F76820F
MSENDDWEVPDAETGRRESLRDERTGRSAAAARIAQQSSWVDLQVRQAMERGEFDNLPGQGKPIEDLGAEHDPDWWVKKLVEREKIALLPPALALRKEDAELDARLDAITMEREVRRELEDFNRRVVENRRQLQGGPPVVTSTRDVDAEVAAWHERRTARIEAQRAARAAAEPAPDTRPWWSRRRTR